MGDRMKVFVLIILLVVDLYNINLIRKNTFRVKKSPYILGGGLILALVVFYLCLNYSKDPFGFLIGILAVGLFFTFTLGQGIREDGFLVCLGNTQILNLVDFDDIKSVSLSTGKDCDLNFKIKAFSSTFEQTYRKEDRDQLVSFVCDKVDSKFVFD